MFYAILAYHVEEVVAALTPEEDAALMTDLLQINERLYREGSLGPAARLGATQDACT
ncbi:MAG: YciI family protein, partial [Mesorhizobium sp.]